MRQAKRFAAAAVVACGWAGAAGAQTTTGTTGSTGSTGSSFGGSNSGGIQSGGNSGAMNQQMQAAPTLSGAATGATANSGTAASNAFGGFYANPLYQGRAGSTGNDNPGGFGTPLYSTAGASGAGTGGFAGGTGRTGSATSRTGTGAATSTAARATTTGAAGGTTRTGTAGGAGGTTRAGGTQGGLGNSSTTNTSQVIALPQQISYTQSLKFPVAQITAPQMQADLRGVLDRSSMLTNARGIQLSMEGGVVILRGKVKNQDEAETAEGMVRLTPGVKVVKNELTY